jgi:HPt (histidine-containing phosphotransfer) domain-containing protein
LFTDKPQKEWSGSLIPATMTDNTKLSTQSIAERAAELLSGSLQDHRKFFDRIMSWVLLFNWVLAVVFALVVSPNTWIGNQKLVHLHVWIALIQGGVMALPPIALAWLLPGRPLTRYTITIAQSVFVALLVHLTGGRIETHFYYFASLAFLAFYRDLKVLIIGTAFIAIDHLFRGIYWPLSAFGTTEGVDWRWVEHAAWVVMMDVVLILAVVKGVREGKQIAQQRAEIENYSENMEELVGERTEQLAAAKKESDAILATVDEGMFIVHRRDDRYAIGSEVSEAAMEILEMKDLAGADLLVSLKEIMTESQLSEVADYLKLIFKPGTDESFVDQLNPLTKVSIHLKAQYASTITKIVDFRFKRITAVDGTISYLVSILDITENMRMAAQIEEHQNRAQTQMEMMMSILHVGANLLEDFIEGVDIEIATIRNALTSSSASDTPRAKLEEIFRAAHSIKGNASLLDLKYLVAQAHEFEEKALILREKKQALAWNDFLPISIELAKLENVFGELKGMIDRIVNFKAEMKGNEQSSIALIPSSTEKLLARLSEEQQKEILFDASAFATGHVANRYAYILRDILVQLARNSVTHGIEMPDERKRIGKPARGTITLASSYENGKHIVKYRDDGRGFDLEGIKNKAIQTGKVAPHEISSWSQQKILKLIFEPGFSTAAETTLHAGRGMGMDIIRQRVKSVEGEMKISFQPGKYVEFVFLLPDAA